MPTGGDRADDEREDGATREEPEGAPNEAGSADERAAPAARTDEDARTEAAGGQDAPAARTDEAGPEGGIDNPDASTAATGEVFGSGDEDSAEPASATSPQSASNAQSDAKDQPNVDARPNADSQASADTPANASAPANADTPANPIAQESAGDRTKGVDEKYCPSCGEIIKKAAEICPECGVRQQGTASGTNEKDAGIAAVLSAITGGWGGQLYNGEIGKGIGLLVLQFVNLLLTAVLVGFLTGFVVWLIGIYDAYNSAQQINRGERSA